MPDKKFYVGIKALVFNTKGELLILKKIPGPGQKWDPFWDIPGGKISDQGIRETLMREVEEELGVTELMIERLQGVCIANFEVDMGEEHTALMFVVYRCSIPDNTKLRLSTEHSEYKWVSVAQARQLLSYMLPKDFLGTL